MPAAVRYKVADDAGNAQLEVSASPLVVPRASVGHFVVARCAARFAVIQTVGTQSHVELALAVHAVSFAQATRFGALAIGAKDAAYAWSRGHG